MFYIRDQAGQLKGKPETKVDPQGAVLKTEKQTVKLEVVAKDFETPWGIAFLPDGRLLVTERPGRLRIVDKGKLLPASDGHARRCGCVRMAGSSTSRCIRTTPRTGGFICRTRKRFPATKRPSRIRGSGRSRLREAVAGRRARRR